MMESVKTNGQGAEVAEGGPALRAWDAEAAACSDTAKVIHLVGRGKRVLELGCGAGEMSQALRDNGCQVVGVEIDPALAERAVAHCESVLTADLDRLNLEAELGENRFDVIVAAEVLEYLKDPWDLLRALKNYLRPGGCFVASLPNVAHGSVRLAPLGGRLPYRNHGQPNGTRLRFFTHESLVCLFEEAGYAVGHLERLELPVDAADPSGRVPANLLQRLADDPDARTAQFVVVAYPLPCEGVEWLQRQVRELAQQRQAAVAEAEELRRRLAEQERAAACQLEELRRGRAEAVSRREADLRADLLDVHDQLVRRDDEFHRAVAELTAHRDRLLSERAALAADRDRITAERDWLAADRAAIIAHRDGLEARVARFRRTLPGLVYRCLRKVWRVAKRAAGR
jgi:2-polyprenyl-3-methyl-5-hydroxy-6-metoxy-1,4-benzoquinol methylase